MRLTVEAGNDKELLQLLKQNGLITDPINDDGSTLLHIAAIKGQLRKRENNMFYDVIDCYNKATECCYLCAFMSGQSSTVSHNKLSVG